MPAGWDLLLESQDEPYDPIAGMVQLWNPLQIYLPSARAVLAELKPERMAVVRALAVEYSEAAEPTSELTRSGEVISRVLNGYSIHTGTSLGDQNDPRRRYQELYREITLAVRNSVTTIKPDLLQQFTGMLKSWAQASSLNLEPYQPIAQPLGNESIASSATRVLFRS